MIIAYTGKAKYSDILRRAIYLFVAVGHNYQY